MPRPQIHEDPMVLLEEHELQLRELTLREHVIEVAALLLDPENDVVERDLYRYELRYLRREERKVQRLNRTSLVLDSATYDAESGDEYTDLEEIDLEVLAWHGITVPGTRPDHGVIITEQHARRDAQGDWWD